MFLYSSRPLPASVLPYLVLSQRRPFRPGSDRPALPPAIRVPASTRPVPVPVRSPLPPAADPLLPAVPFRFRRAPPSFQRPLLCFQSPSRSFRRSLLRFRRTLRGLRLATRVFRLTVCGLRRASSLPRRPGPASNRTRGGSSGRGSASGRGRSSCWPLRRGGAPPTSPRACGPPCGSCRGSRSCAPGAWFGWRASGSLARTGRLRSWRRRLTSRRTSSKRRCRRRRRSR